MVLNRVVWTLATVVVLGSCDDPAGPPRPVGAYTLQTIDEQTLPIIDQRTEQCEWDGMQGTRQYRWSAGSMDFHDQMADFEIVVHTRCAPPTGEDTPWLNVSIFEVLWVADYSDGRIELRDQGVHQYTGIVRRNSIELTPLDWSPPRVLEFVKSN